LVVVGTSGGESDSVDGRRATERGVTIDGGVRSDSAEGRRLPGIFDVAEDGVLISESREGRRLEDLDGLTRGGRDDSLVCNGTMVVGVVALWLAATNREARGLPARDDEGVLVREPKREEAGVFVSEARRDEHGVDDREVAVEAVGSDDVSGFILRQHCFLGSQ